MCEIFAEMAIKRFSERSKKYVVGYGTKLVSNLAGWSQEHHSHDEADTLIICVTREMARLNNSLGTFSVKILSPDTDVLMLAIDYSLNQPTINIVFELLSGKARRKLAINMIIEKLGESRAKGLLGAYVSTGCDQIGKFSSVTKARAFTVFIQGPDIIADGLSQLGQDISEVSDSALNAVTNYVNLLYAKKKEDRDVVGKFKDTGELRWHLFTKNQQESDQLPPTPSALKFHIQRANYICGLWKLLSNAFDPEIKSPTENGWEEKDGMLRATMTDQLPAPDYSLELNSCKCKKSKCVKGKCSCSANGLRCTDLCKCLDCENVEMRFQSLDESDMPEESPDL